MRRALLVVLLVLASCASFDQTAARAIVAANGAQDAAAQAYTVAKKQTEDAGRACGAAGRAAGVTLPTLSADDPESGARAVAACRALGVVVPYNPVILNKLVGPLNSAYDAIRAANDVRVAVKAGQGGDYYAALNQMVSAVTRFYTAAKEAGLKLDVAPLEALEKAAK